VKSKPAHDAATKTAQAYTLLNGYIGDLDAGKFGLITFDKLPQFATASKAMRQILRRMCLSHLVLTLSKLEDLYDEYKAVFPKDVRDGALDLKKELVRRGVRNFRNSVVGHFRDKKLKRPLTGEEIEDRIALIIGESLESFQAWIDTVAEKIELIRNQLAPAKRT
jgi:hypothetical protein